MRPAGEKARRSLSLLFRNQGLSFSAKKSSSGQGLGAMETSSYQGSFLARTRDISGGTQWIDRVFWIAVSGLNTYSLSDIDPPIDSEPISYSSSFILLILPSHSLYTVLHVTGIPYFLYMFWAPQGALIFPNHTTPAHFSFFDLLAVLTSCTPWIT